MNELLDKKINEALSSDIISKISFDESEINEMKITVSNALSLFNERGVKYFYPSEIKYLLLLIVNYAKDWGDGDENRFWLKIFGNIFDNVTYSISAKFYDEVEKVLNQYNKKIFKSKTGKRMLRETMLFHAYAPRISVDAFIKLLFNFCIDDDNINRNYLNDRTICKRIADGLAKKFGKTESDSMDQDFEFDGNSYSVRSGIKYGCLQNKDTIISMIEYTMSCFDSILYGGQEIQDTLYGSYIYNTINAYLAQNSALKRKTSTKTQSDPIVSDFSKIYSYYEIQNNKPILSIPEIRIFDDTYKVASIELLINDKKVNKVDLDIIGKDFKRKIKKYFFNILDYLDDFIDTINFKIKLYLDDNLIFDSKNDAYRRYVLLNESKEMKKDCKPGSYYIVYPQNIKIKDFTNCEITGISTSFATITSIENDNISYKNKNMFFNSQKQNSHILINGVEIENSKFNQDEIEYRIFNKIADITLLINDYNPDLIIFTHNYDFPVMDLSKNSEKLEDNTYKITLEKTEMAKQGLHRLIFRNLKDNKIIECLNYIILEKLKVKFDKPYYFDKQVGSLTIYDQGNECYAQKIDASINNVSIAYGFNQIQGKLQIDCPNIKFKIDNGEWQYFCFSKPLWHKFFHSGSVLIFSNNSNCNLKVFNENNLVQQLKTDEYNLSNIILNSNSNESNIIVEINGQSYTLFKIAFTELLSGGLSFVLENNFIIHNLGSIFIGDLENSIFKLVLTNEENVKFFYKFKINDIIEAKNLAESYYCVELFLIHEGLYDDTETKLYSSNNDLIPFGNILKFEYKDSNILLLNTRTPKEKVKFDNVYIDNIRYKEEELYPVYVGILHGAKTKSANIEFERKDDHSLKIYFYVNDEIKLANIDSTTKLLTISDVNDKNVFECFSCYYKKENKNV